MSFVQVRSLYAAVYAEPPYGEGPQDVADFMIAQLETDTWVQRKPVIVY
jgi:16S rRNA G966 N2-methylase RsmD